MTFYDLQACFEALRTLTNQTLLLPVRWLALAGLVLIAALLTHRERPRPVMKYSPISGHARLSPELSFRGILSYIWVNAHTVAYQARMGRHSQTLLADWPSGVRLGVTRLYDGNISECCNWGAVDSRGNVVWMDGAGLEPSDTPERPSWAIWTPQGRRVARFVTPARFDSFGLPVWLNVPLRFLSLAEKGNMLYALLGDARRSGALRAARITRIDTSRAGVPAAVVAGVTRTGTVAVLLTRNEVGMQGRHPEDRLLTFRIENGAVSHVRVMPVPVHAPAGYRPQWIEAAADPCSDRLGWLVESHTDPPGPGRPRVVASYMVSNANGGAMRTIAEEADTAENMPIYLRWRPDGAALSVLSRSRIHVIPVG